MEEYAKELRKNPEPYRRYGGKEVMGLVLPYALGFLVAVAFAIGVVEAVAGEALISKVILKMTSVSMCAAPVMVLAQNDYETCMIFGRKVRRITIVILAMLIINFSISITGIALAYSSRVSMNGAEVLALTSEMVGCMIGCLYVVIICLAWIWRDAKNGSSGAKEAPSGLD